MVKVNITDFVTRVVRALATCFVLCGCAGMPTDIRNTDIRNAATRNADILNAGVTLPLSDSLILDVSFRSEYSGTVMRCKAYFPRGYGDGREYPVLYALNGSGSDERMWIDAGLPSSVDRLIAGGIIEPLVIVFPRTTAVTQEELRKDLDDDGKYGERTMDLVIRNEVVPYIDEHFDTVKNRDGRFICGYSMGGMVAVRVALHHPDAFGKVAGYSPALLDADFSALQLERWLNPNDEPSGASGFSGLAVYLDAGYSSDPFYARVRSLHEALVRRGASSEFHPYDGGHSLAYANGDFGDYMRFFVPAESVISR